MTVEARAGGGSPEESPVRLGAIPVLTGGAAPMAVRVFPGLPEQAAHARRWVRALASGPGGPDPDGLDLVVTELFANAILHTRSGEPGGKVTIAVTADDVIHIHDYGTGAACPGLAGRLSAGGDQHESGRGLAIVAALSAGPVHLPAAWCPAAWPGDPSIENSGCCTCCRPAPAEARPGSHGEEAGHGRY